MRFISRNSNLRVILKPGIPAEPLTGRAGDPGLSVKFLDGVLEVKDESIIERMKNHPGCEVDYWFVEDGWKDPFKNTREESEPAHIISEFKYGRPDRTLSSAKPPKISPELEKIINARAIEIAKGLLPEMIEHVIKEGAEKHKAKTADEVSNTAEDKEESEDVSKDKSKSKPKKKSAGRPKAIKKEVPTEEVLTTEEDKEIKNAEDVGKLS